MVTPTDLQSSISSIQWTNGRGLITGATLLGVMTVVLGIFGTLGTWSSSGVFTPNIPAGTVTQAMLAPGVGGGSVIVVPIRTATDATDATSASDFLVCLNGPTQETLEQAPPLGTTHVLKDCRAPGGSPIQVFSQGPDTIDGGPSFTFTFARQAMTVSYSSLGWQVY